MQIGGVELAHFLETIPVLSNEGSTLGPDQAISSQIRNDVAHLNGGERECLADYRVCDRQLERIVFR